MRRDQGATRSAASLLAKLVPDRTGERAPMTPPFTWVETDAAGDGCKTGFFVRDDLAASVMEIHRTVRAWGGFLTSSGGTRALTAEIHAARSPVSLHYLGRAVDLCIRSGMQSATDPYAVIDEPNPNDPERPWWRVLCRGTDDFGEPLSAPLNQIWRSGAGGVTLPRHDAFFDLTALFAEHGWTRIPARPGWRTNYLCVEWWHFECHRGLTPGESRFGDQLAALYSAAEIANSPLAVSRDRVWNGRYFAPDGG